MGKSIQIIPLVLIFTVLLALPVLAQTCIHKAEIPPCDGYIDMRELSTFIDRWKVNNQDVSLRDIIEAIGLWKTADKPLDLAFLSDSIKVCNENCDSLPLPIFKVCPTNNLSCNPESYYLIKFYLENKPLLTFQTPMGVYKEGIDWTGNLGYSYTENFSLILVYDKGVVTQVSNHFRFSGTNKFIVYQDDFIDDSKPLVLWIMAIDKKIYGPENVTTKYNIIKNESGLGSLRVINREGFECDINNIYNKISEVTQTIDSLTNKEHVNFSIIFLPDPISLFIGAEGNFYMGNGKITVHYVENSIYNESVEISHEYAHGIEFERGPFNGRIKGNTVCFYEGLADAVTVHLNYSSVDKLSAGNQPSEGCVIPNYDMPHTVGRCIFKYLRNNSIDSDEFYNSIFNPNYTYEFDSCDLNSSKTCDSYNVLFSEAYGSDLTSFMTNIIKCGNCSSNLMEAKRNIGLI